MIPQREIKTPADMQRWLRSGAYEEFMKFVLSMNSAIEGLNRKSLLLVSDPVSKLTAMLDELDDLINETPPVIESSRFGNSAFRTWFDKMSASREDLLKRTLPESLHEHIEEIGAYLVDSFGNKTRIDYGTGHEMNFAIFLMCLFKLKFLIEPDAPAVICHVFERYMRLVRRLQLDYRMEPAGSHGVWSLDDYQFLPFVWGSSQLNVASSPVSEISSPCQFMNEGIPEKYEDDYLFLACIAYINRVKKGPFFEHSNQLYNASGTPSWQRLNEGLIRMYKAEVLSKFPVIQHVLFGSLFPVAPATSTPQ